MTLSASAQVSRTAGNGTTTVFAYSATLWAASELLVYLVSSAGVATLKTITTHYTLSTSSFPASSLNVTMLTAPAVGETLVLIRSQALSQALDLIAADPLDSALVERRFDILTGMVQNLSERLDRAVTLPIHSALTNLHLDAPTSGNDGDCVTWDDGAEGFVYSASTDLNVTLVSSFMSSLLDDANAATARQTLALKETFIIAVSDETTAITTGTAKVTFRMPYAFTLSEIPRASLTTASSGAAPQVDINEGGVSILSTKLTIDANEKTSTTAATAAVLSDSALADDAEITIDIDTAGTGAAGLKVYMTGYRT